MGITSFPRIKPSPLLSTHSKAIKHKKENCVYVCEGESRSKAKSEDWIGNVLSEIRLVLLALDRKSVV